MLEKINLSDIKTINFNKIVQYITNCRDAEIADIAKATALSIPTIKKSVDFGISQGILIAKDFAKSTGGRKATIYEANSEYYYVVYFVVDNLTLCVKIENFVGDVVYNGDKKIELVDILDEICSEFLRLNLQFDGKIKHICIALPCVVDNGVVKEWYYAPQNANLDIESFVKEKLGVGVVVENDMKACARAYSGNIATAQFGHNGIGIGIMVDGHVLRGKNGFAGEVGFIEDINRNIMSVRYCAKIIRALICFCNPSEIIFYSSERQNDFDKIMDEAMKKMPAYTKPKVVVSNDYIEDILKGLKILSIDERTIDVSQVKFV